jgi:hypothetical protein
MLLNSRTKFSFLVDSGVYAGNTAELMLFGKEFNRAVRGFTLVIEALRSIHTLV